MEEQFQKLTDEVKALGASAFKLELESEFLNEEKCFEILKSINKNLKLILKLGGFSSYNDICLAKKLGANVITAPMIETSYALEKFVRTVLNVYGENLDIDLLINIETKNAVKNLGEILSSPYMKYVAGIVLGRKDLALSYDFSEDIIESTAMFNLIYPVVEYCTRWNKKFILGGEISPVTADFIKMFTQDALFGFETRKLFFRYSNAKNLENTIAKAIEYEIFFVENFLKEQPSALKRVETLKKRLIKNAPETGSLI